MANNYILAKNNYILILRSYESFKKKFTELLIHYQLFSMRSRKRRDNLIKLF